MHCITCGSTSILLEIFCCVSSYISHISVIFSIAMNEDVLVLVARPKRSLSFVTVTSNGAADYS